MATRNKNLGASSMQWLFAWQNNIHALLTGPDPGVIDYRDMLLKYHLPRLDILLKDVAVTDLLSETYTTLQAEIGQTQARASIRHFVSDACWLCAPKLNAAQLEKQKEDPDRSSQAKKLRSIARATRKLANGIVPFLKTFGHNGSIAHLQSLMSLGCQESSDASDNGAWESALTRPAQPSITDLLNCFSDEVNAQAKLIQTQIAASRQKSGARASLYFVMDTLTTTSIQLSMVTPPEPHFPLVTAVIESLMPNSESLDIGTIRRRYSTKQSRKTRAKST